jgi:hypothetical protein
MGSSKTNNRSLYIDTEALTLKERLLNKAQKATLSLGRLQQSAHVSSHIKKGVHYGK